MQRNQWMWLAIAAAIIIIAAMIGGNLLNKKEDQAMNTPESTMNTPEPTANTPEPTMSTPEPTESTPVPSSSEPTEMRQYEFENSVAVNVNLSNLGQKIENKFTDLNQWELGMDWLDNAKGQPADYIRTHYPFIKRVQLMTATGGIASRDLFIDPEDRDNLTDYNFTRLGDAVENIVRQGLIPHIATGNVPLKYSSEPFIGGFGVNVRPPDDYDVYFNYIKALAEYMVDRFGINEVRTWIWRSLVEFENIDWFDAGDPESSKVAYSKLYDYTVAALEEVIGAEHLYVGAHSMTNGPGPWDEREFIDHVAAGINYYTGKQGTQLDFLSFSYYDHKPGVMSAQTLESNLQLLRERALEHGLTDLVYGVDEGRMMLGPDDKELFPRTVATSYQSALDAKLFKHMHDINLYYFSTWYLNTERIWGETKGVDPTSTHLAQLAYRMEGANRATVEAASPLTEQSNEVDGISAYHEHSHTAQLLMYNFNLSPDATSSEPVTITFDHVEAVSPDGKVTVKQWLLDDEHANYWPKWKALMEERGITSADFGGWSSDTWTISSVAASRVHNNWYSRVEDYQELSKLEAMESTFEIKNNQLVLTHLLAPHGVAFYEISGIKPLVTPDSASQ